MSSRVWTAILGLLLCAPPAAAAQAPAGDRKQAMALRVPDGSIRLDGRLDEEVWRRAVAVTDFTRDFNTLSFRSNVVLRWEWRPGSTLYLVWQQDRSETETLGGYVNVGDMFRSVAAPGRNSFVVKTSF